MPIVIDPDTERLVRRLADATGTTLDAAVHDAVRARLSAIEPPRVKHSADAFDAEIARIQAETKASGPTPSLPDNQHVLDAIARAQARIAALPVLNARSGDDMLYDEYGLPK